jgi:glycosyltransferase involved in cell wall biosynthesis
MRIAQVAPLYESVPPRLYGGTERVVSYLTEELVRRGHDVTLFASGDSNTRARLVACAPHALRLDERCVDQLAHHMYMLGRVFEEADRFDLIHWHIDYLHYPLSSLHPAAGITTLHGRLDIPDLTPLYRFYSRIPVVSVSDAQRRPLPFANWVGTVHHGLPEDLYTLREHPGDYLAFVGRISPEKRVDRAIEIAGRAGIPLRIAAKIASADRSYYDQVIAPLLRKHPEAEYIGELGENEKDAFFGQALALVFPIDWPEPFGLVMIEAMACGTPVIAYRGGSVEEILEDGNTGYLVSSIPEAADAVDRARSHDRRRCRAVFERRFTARRMANHYLKLYGQVCEGGSRVGARPEEIGQA